MNIAVGDKSVSDISISNISVYGLSTFFVLCVLAVVILYILGYFSRSSSTAASAASVTTRGPSGITTKAPVVHPVGSSTDAPTSPGRCQLKTNTCPSALNKKYKSICEGITSSFGCRTETKVDSCFQYALPCEWIKPTKPPPTTEPPVTTIPATKGPCGGPDSAYPLKIGNSCWNKNPCTDPDNCTNTNFYTTYQLNETECNTLGSNCPQASCQWFQGHCSCWYKPTSTKCAQQVATSAPISGAGKTATPYISTANTCNACPSADASSAKLCTFTANNYTNPISYDYRSQYWSTLTQQGQCIPCSTGSRTVQVHSATSNRDVSVNQFKMYCGNCCKGTPWASCLESEQQKKCVDMGGYYLANCGGASLKTESMGICKPCTVCGENEVNTTCGGNDPSSFNQPGVCECKKGYYLKKGKCVQCEPFTYKDTVGNTACSPCAPCDTTSGCKTEACYRDGCGPVNAGTCNSCQPCSSPGKYRKDCGKPKSVTRTRQLLCDTECGTLENSSYATSCGACKSSNGVLTCGHCKNSTGSYINNPSIDYKAKNCVGVDNNDGS